MARTPHGRSRSPSPFRLSIESLLRQSRRAIPRAREHPVSTSHPRSRRTDSQEPAIPTPHRHTRVAIVTRPSRCRVPRVPRVNRNHLRSIADDSPISPLRRPLPLPPNISSSTRVPLPFPERQRRLSIPEPPVQSRSPLFQSLRTVYTTYHVSSISSPHASFTPKVTYTRLSRGEETANPSLRESPRGDGISGMFSSREQS
jgi:hypothetical protein